MKEIIGMSDVAAQWERMGDMMLRWSYDYNSGPVICEHDERMAAHYYNDAKRVRGQWCGNKR